MSHPADLAALDVAAIVAAVEQAYVAVGRGEAVATAGLDPAWRAVAAGAAATVASRFLAVGTPRSIGLLGGGEPGAAGWEVCRAALAAHRVLFAPREIRCANLGDTGDGEAFAREVGGRLVSLEQAAACDIVCVTAVGALIPRAWLRGGTHVNLLVGGAPAIEAEVMADAMLVVERPDAGSIGAAGVAVYGTLAEIAAGWEDGRQLDEISVFEASDLAAAFAGIARTRA